jgi:glutamyl aminopeptidase
MLCRFATYYSYIGQNATNPEYEPLKQLFTDSTQYAMGLDSRERSSYPLLLTATSQYGLEREATGLPYYKGAALIRMMNGFLTPQTFEKGIKLYLKRW